MKKPLFIPTFFIAILSLCGCGSSLPNENSTENTTEEKYIKIDRTQEESESNTESYTTIKSVLGVVFNVPNSILDSDYILNPILLNSDSFSYESISNKSNYEFSELDLSSPVLIKSPSEFLYINSGDTVYYVGKQTPGESNSIYGVTDDNSLYNSIANFSNNGINNINDIEDLSFDDSIPEVLSCMANIQFTDSTGYPMSGMIKILETKNAQYYFIYGTLSDGANPNEESDTGVDDSSDKEYDPDIENFTSSFQLTDEAYDSSTLLASYETGTYTFDYGGRKATIPLSTVFKIDPQNKCYNLPGAYYKTSISANEYYGVSVGYSYYKLPVADIKPEEFLAWWSLPYLDYNMTKEEILDRNGNTWIKTKSDQRYVTGNEFYGSYVCIYSLQRKKSAYVFTLIYKPSVIDYETLFETGLKSVELSKGESEKYTLNDDYVNYILYDLEQKQLFSYCMTADQRDYLKKLYNEIDMDGKWDRFGNMISSDENENLFEGEITEEMTTEKTSEEITEAPTENSTEETTARSVKLPNEKEQ